MDAHSARNEPVVLLVEDDPQLRELYRFYLLRNGFNVLLAENGKEAVDTYRACQDTIELVLMDMQMPHQDGASAFQAIQRMNPHVVCCLMSAFWADEQRDEVLNGGAARILHKPFALPELSRLHELLGNRAAGNLFLLNPTLSEK